MENNPENSFPFNPASYDGVDISTLPLEELKMIVNSYKEIQKLPDQKSKAILEGLIQAVSHYLSFDSSSEERKKTLLSMYSPDFVFHASEYSAREYKAYK